MKVSLFINCLVDTYFTNAGKAAVNLLESLGCQVDMPDGQVCCSQSVVNAGYVKDAKKSYKNIIKAFEESEVVVSLSGSCVFMLKECPDLFQDEPEWKMRAEQLSRKTYEFTQFLVDVLKVDTLNSTLPKKVFYHPSCKTVRGLGVKDQPVKLLQMIEGIEIVDFKGSELCCGAGGNFAIEMSRVGDHLIDEKVQRIIDSGAEVIVGTDCSCLLNLKGKIERLCEMGMLDRTIEVFHIAEILVEESE